MAKRNWEKLDNTANIFPVIAGEELTNTYRISAVMTESIDPVLLQEALDLLLPKFPGFNLRIRRGIFWYYLEENGKPAPRVKMEDEYPCRIIHGKETNSYLFRVSFYRDRINLEVFHAIADGMGGVTFLRELVYQYLRLKYPELQERLGDELSSETSLNREDSFKANFKEAKKNTYQKKRAFLFRGEHLAYHGFGVVHGFMSIRQLKEVCRNKYGISINEYLVSAFVYAAYRANRKSVSAKRPIRVAVPVNLRPYFGSITTKNFFAMVSAEFYPRDTEGDYSFGAITTIIHESLKKQVTKEHLEEIFSYNVSNEEMFIARAVPLTLKNLAMRIIYTRSALANTTTITNIGNISVMDEYRPYIRRFIGFLALSKGQELKGTISSFGDELVYTFTSLYADTSVQREVFRQLSRDGVTVTIETNGVYQ